MDNGDLREQIVRLEVHIEDLAEAIESCRKVILISKTIIAVGGILILAMPARDGQVRSYDYDWRDCGYDRGHRRLRVEHGYVEADYGRTESRRGTQSRVDQQDRSSDGRR
jgi:hypothetical protein